MLRKTLEIATPGTRLSIRHRQLVIERPDHPPITRPVEEIGLLILEHPRLTLTQPVLVQLAEAGAAVLVTGPDHLPLGLLLPLTAHHAPTQRHHAQIAASAPLQKRLWQAIIAAKLRQQARLLATITGQNHGLAAMARRVRSGDPENLEAQAAQRYWPALMGADFKRNRDQPGANAALNYGYAILRAALARALVAAGLLPSLGVFHHNRANPFCLADDLLEPFRPLVDQRVHAWHATADAAAQAPLDPPARASLLAILSQSITLGGRTLPVSLAIEAAASSLAQSFLEKSPRLLLPESLALPPGPNPE